VLLTKNERGGGLDRRGVCANSRAGDKAARVSVAPFRRFSSIWNDSSRLSAGGQRA
jgi:hypothetical protein